MNVSKNNLKKLTENKKMIRKKLSEDVDNSNFLAFITNLGKYNEGELVGKWVSFPIDEEDFDKVLDDIGINDEYEEWFVTDYDGNFSDVANSKLGEYPSYDDLQYFGEICDSIDDSEIATVFAVMDYAGYDIEEAVEMVSSGDATLHDDIFSDSDVGNYFVDLYGGVSELSKDELENYFDYEAFGRDIRLSGNVIITRDGMLEINR